MRIATRIGIGFAATLLLLAGIIVVNDMAAREHESEVATYRTGLGLLDAVHALDREVLELQRDSAIFVNTGHRSIINRVQGNGERLGAILVGLDGKLEGDMARVTERLGALRKEYMEAFGRLAEDRARRDELTARLHAQEVQIEQALRMLPDPAVASATLDMFTQAVRQAADYMADPDSRAVEAFKTTVEEVATSCDEASDPGGTLREALLAYEGTLLLIVQTVRGYLFTANVVLAGMAAEFRYNSSTLRAHFDASQHAAMDRLLLQVRGGRKLTLRIAWGALALGLLLSWATSRSITRPLTAMTRTFAELASGAKNADIPAVGRSDEIGSLAKAAQVFKERNQQTQQLLEASDRHGREMESQADELARKNDELEQFAYVASHDLQEPLRMVASYVELIKEKHEGQLGADTDKWLGFAWEGATRMRGLIRDLLDISRVRTMPVEPVETDTAAIVQTLLAELQPSIDETGSEIRIRSELPTLRALPRLLTQAFQNLITNAIKYRSDDRPAVIDISAKQTPEGWLFSVQDNGIGIEHSHHDRVFKLFKRLHTRDKYPGNGMGLAITEKIAHQHNGRVWVDSTPGVGSTFYLLIGPMEDAADDAEAPQTKKPSSGPSASANESTSSPSACSMPT